jgi:Na+-transporting NADH:ubiquinone oxidoreductase subunit F
MILLTSKLGIILISIAVFILIILSLVALLMYARSKLVPQGEVSLKVNEEEFKVQPGGTVLSTLSNQNIYLPSACGGGGTCAMCKCQVLEGGGTILPTETGFFHS